MTWLAGHSFRTYPPLFHIVLLKCHSFSPCDLLRGERCNLSPLSHPFSPAAFLPLTPPKQTHSPPLLCHGADGLFFKLISKMYISSRSPSPDYLLIFNMKSSLYKQELQHKKLANLCINPLIEFPEPVVLHFLIKSISFFKGCCVICML